MPTASSACASSRDGTSTSGIATCRNAPTERFPNIQIREREWHYPTPLDAFLARTDDAAHEYLADCLTFEREIDPSAAPLKQDVEKPEFVEAEG